MHAAPPRLASTEYPRRGVAAETVSPSRVARAQVRVGVDAARCAAGAAVFDASLPVSTHAGLRRLSALATSNPLQCGATLPDAGEAIAMLREALEEQAERLVEANARQAEEEAACGPERLGEVRRVRVALERQHAHVAFLRDFIERREGLFREDGGVLGT